MKNETQNRIWLVVGASRDGIGAAIARAAAKQGDRVIITGAEDTPLSMPDGVEAYHYLDVCDSKAISALAKNFPRLHTLVNCAAISCRDE